MLLERAREAARRRLDYVGFLLRRPHLERLELATAFDLRDTDLLSGNVDDGSLATAGLENRLKSYFQARLLERVYGATSLDSRHLEARAPGTEIADLLTEAEAVLRHELRVLGLGKVKARPVIDWHRDYVTGKQWPRRHWSRVSLTPGDGADIKLVWELNRHQHFLLLAASYHLTKNERYAEEFVGQLASWLEENPVAVGVNWTEGVEIGLRLISWVWALPLVLPSRSFDERLLTRTLHSVRSQASHIRRNLSTYRSPNTHLIGEGAALFIVGTVFREFKEADSWRRVGWAVLTTEIVKQVGDDGLYRECSFCYHCYVVEFYSLALIIAHRSGIAWDSVVAQRLEMMLEVLRWVARPDGTLPMVGDCDGGRVLRLTRQNYRDAKDLLCLGAVLLGRLELKSGAGSSSAEAAWLMAESCDRLTNLPIGSKPRGLRYFRDARLFVDRRVFEDDERYLLFDCGDLGMLQGGHGHAGCLGIEIFACNRSLLVDPGTYAYNGARTWRDYFRSTKAHNTVVVDGCDQAELGSAFQWETRFTPTVHRYFAAGAYALVEASHNGYERLTHGVTHRRMILSVLGEYWLCLDRLTGKDSHDLDFLFHFPATGVVESVEATRCVTVIDGVAGVAIIGLGDDAMRSRVALGEVDPIQGWYSDDYGRKEPAPVAIFSERCRMPTVRGFIILPFLVDKRPELDVVSERLDDGCAVIVNRGASRERICYTSGESRTWARDEVEFVGNLLHLRQVGEDARAFIACGVRRLAWRGKTVVESESPVSLISFSDSEEGLYVQTESSQTIKVAVPGQRRPVMCHINGVREAIETRDDEVILRVRQAPGAGGA